MLKKILLFFSFSLCIFGCKKSVQETKTISKKSAMSIAIKHSTSDTLDGYSSNKIKDWKEYKELKDFLNRFDNTSPSEALNNALELKELTKKLKDSIRIRELKIASFKARINTLENETLRLADMTFIPAITSKEVNTQVDKIFLIFGSLNTKINTIYNQQRFDEEIALDDFFKVKPEKNSNSRKRIMPKK